MKLWCCIAVLVLLVCVCHSAHGDGGYIPRIDYGSINKDVAEPTQKAALIHVDGHERLILQALPQDDVSQFRLAEPRKPAPAEAL